MTSLSLELLRIGRPVAVIHAGTPLAANVLVTTTWLYHAFAPARRLRAVHVLELPRP
jgi:hypothetical protein